MGAGTTTWEMMGAREKAGVRQKTGAWEVGVMGRKLEGAEHPRTSRFEPGTVLFCS